MQGSLVCIEFEFLECVQTWCPYFHLWSTAPMRRQVLNLWKSIMGNPTSNRWGTLKERKSYRIVSYSIVWYYIVFYTENYSHLTNVSKIKWLKIFSLADMFIFLAGILLKFFFLPRSIQSSLISICWWWMKYDYIKSNHFYSYSQKSKSNCLSRLYNLYSEPHPLCLDPRTEWGKTCHVEKETPLKRKKKPRKVTGPLVKIISS